MNPITQTIKEIKPIFEANFLDGDKVQGGQVFSSEECLEAIYFLNIALLESVVGVVEGMKKPDEPKRNIIRRGHIEVHNRSIQTILTELQEALKELKDNK